jgi:hypothetical protein
MIAKTGFQSLIFPLFTFEIEFALHTFAALKKTKYG